MRRITKKEVIKIAVAQNKFTNEFKVELEKFYARYQLRLIEKEELFALLNIQK